MKRVLLIIVLLNLITGCGYNFEKINLDDLIFSPSQGETTEEEYIDNNQLKISMYAESDGKINRVKNTYVTEWIKKQDIVVLSSFLSDETELTGNYYQEIWNDCLLKYSFETNFKIGWSISFGVKNGQNISKTIFHPDDVSEFYDIIEIYLYDSVNQPLGSWYSHLTSKDMKTDTLLTTMKITAGTNYEQVDGDILVEVFTYDDETDFDDSGKYRGNSVHRIRVSDK